MKAVCIRRLPLLCTAVCTVLATGCMPKMTLEEMKAAKPQRPAEIDHLGVFVGTWEWEGEAQFATMDEPIKTSGTATGKWGGDRWFIVSDGLFRMEGFGEMHGHETWTYDAKAKKYRSSWVDSMGSTGSGTGTYCPKSKTWRMKAKINNPFGKSTGKGVAKIIDDNTMEWCWTEYAMGMKTMEMKGTSYRK